MKNAITMLIRLSEVDTEIEKLEEDQHDVPTASHNFNQQIASLELEIRKIANQISEIENRKKELNETVQTKSEWLQTREEQIKDLKTNKEFHAAQKEISLAKKEITDSQTALVQLSEQVQLLTQQHESIKGTNQPKIDELRNLIKTEESKLTDLAPQVEAKLKIRRSLIVEIDSKILQVYERIRGKVTPALAKAQNFVCLECGSRMQPQVYNQLHICDTMHFCKNCKRIIYLEEALHPPSA